MVARDLSVVGLPRSVVTQETLLDAADQLDNADTADGASLIREAAEQMPDSATILIAKILADCTPLKASCSRKWPQHQPRSTSLKHLAPLTKSCDAALAVSFAR